MPTHLHRLIRLTIRTPIPHLSSTSRHRLRQIQKSSRTTPEFLTPYHAHAHPLQLTTAAFHITVIELIVLLSTIGILVAFLCWIGWILFTYVLRRIKEKIDDYDIGKGVGDRDRTDPELLKHTPNASGKVANVLGTGARRLFEGLTRTGGWTDREGGERIGLLHEQERERRESEARTFEYNEGLISPGRYMNEDGDVAGESTGTEKIAVVHREDCIGQCGQARKRSIDV